MDSFEMTKIVGAVLAAVLLLVGSSVVINARLAQPAGQPANGFTLPTAEVAAAEPEAPAAETPAAAAPAPAAPAPAAPAPAAPAAAPAKSAAPAPATAPAPAPTPAPAKEAAAPAKAPAAPAPAPAAAPAPAPAAGGFNTKAVVALLATAKPEDGATTFRKCSTCHQIKKDVPSVAAPNLWNVVNRPKASQPDFVEKYSAGMKAKGGAWTYEDIAAFLHQPKAYVAGTKMAFPGIKDPAEIAAVIAYLRMQADTPAPLPK
jgi:cytochrome c